MKTPELLTERLRLRAVCAADVQPVFACWMQDEEVSRYMCWSASDDPHEAENFVRFELDNVSSDSWKRWMIELRQTGELIGTCLIFRNEEAGCWDISYNLGRKYWGFGYATEAMRCALDYAIAALGLRECIAVHAEENPASGRVITNLGFQFEKQVPYVCGGGAIRTTGMQYRLIVPPQQNEYRMLSEDETQRALYTDCQDTRHKSYNDNRHKTMEGTTMNQRLYKSNREKMIDGVCGGVAEYFNIDPTLVRLAWILFCAMGGSGILAYIVAAIVIPRSPEF